MPEQQNPAAQNGTDDRMPAEGDPHERTWMAYGATPEAWVGDDSAPGRDLANSRAVARHDVLRVAATLSRFEPVTLLVRDAADEAEARRHLADVVSERSVQDQIGAVLDGSGRIFLGDGADSAELPPIGSFPIDFHRAPLNDLWARDMAPIFVAAGDAGGDAGQRAVALNFNGWGEGPLSTGLAGWRPDPEKHSGGVSAESIRLDRAVAAAITSEAGVPAVSTWLTMEGGGLMVNGSGVGIATESCILNPNRNPGVTKHEVEQELRRLFGIELMLWMPGVAGQEITDGHIDFTARFAAPDLLVYAFDASYEPEDARNETAFFAAIEQVNALPGAQRARLLGGSTALLTAQELPTPALEKVHAAVRRRNTQPPIAARSLDDFIHSTAAGYIGYYEANGCILLGQFGDVDADRAAFDAVSALYPDRVVVQLATDGISNGGGTIHCATQQQPRIADARNGDGM